MSLSFADFVKCSGLCRKLDDIAVHCSGYRLSVKFYTNFASLPGIADLAWVSLLTVYFQTGHLLPVVIG